MIEGICLDALFAARVDGRAESCGCEWEECGTAATVVSCHRARASVLALATLAAVLLAANYCQAVILSPGASIDNTTAPEDDPGWNNVGSHGRGGAVYLGNRWVITADHLNHVENITFYDVPFDVEVGSETPLTNPESSGLTFLTDLRLVRLEEEPELPPLPISATTPPIDSEVVMIGRGRDREQELTLWNVNVFGDEVRWSETEFPPYDQSGFKWATTQTMRWGTNIVEDDLELNSSEIDEDQNVVADVENVNVVSFLTRFDDSEDADLTEHEGHATLGDSGGAVFFNNDGQWELAGIMFAVSVGNGQPDNTAVFGNFTVSADLSFYREQIEAIVSAPVLQAGDANRDFSFDQFDLVRVAQGAKYRTGQPATWGEGDWNGAPGGSPGNPPPGDGRFDQLDIVAAQQTGLYLTGSYAGKAMGEPIDQGSPSLVYDAKTGELALFAPDQVDLTSILIQSESAIFAAHSAENLGGRFDAASAESIFKATFGSSFGSLSFGRITAAGLEEAFLVSDLSVVGSLAGGGGLGEVGLMYLAIPEPATAGLLVLGLLVTGSVWVGSRYR